jgi:hypothetical protein
LCTAVSSARGDFQTARYDRLAVGLHGVIATAVAARRCAAGSQRVTADSLLADTYIA